MTSGLRLIGTSATAVPCQRIDTNSPGITNPFSHLSTLLAPSSVIAMAASSGHLTPAEAATPVRTPLQRPNSVGSDVSRRSAVPTIASSLGNFRDHGANSQASGSGTQPVQRTASGRSIPAGYHLRGSRTPSLRDPNAHLDELKQVPERAEVVPPVPPLVSQASDQEDAAIRQAIKKGSKVFHRRRSKRSGDSESDGDSETASRKHFRRRETDSSVEQQTREARAQIAKRREKVIDLYDGDEQITSAGEVPAVERPQKPVYVWEGEYPVESQLIAFNTDTSQSCTRTNAV